MLNAMSHTTAIVLLIWQAGLLWRLIDNRRNRRIQKAFWERHDKNMEAIRKGMPVPYPNNSHDWPREASGT